MSRHGMIRFANIRKSLHRRGTKSAEVGNQIPDFLFKSLRLPRLCGKIFSYPENKKAPVHDRGYVDRPSRSGSVRNPCHHEMMPPTEFHAAYDTGRPSIDKAIILIAPPQTGKASRRPRHERAMRVEGRAMSKPCESNGASGGIRTPNPQIRSLVLCPVELRAQRSPGLRPSSRPSCASRLQ